MTGQRFSKRTQTLDRQSSTIRSHRIYGPKLGHRLPISRNDRRFAGNRIFDQCREMSLASKTPTDFIRLV
jgi:hypothetical protein